MTVLDTLGLAEWPFAVVPDGDRAANLWADRELARSQLKDILQSWERSAASSLHLIWADLGAGKTHTLMHLRSIGVENDLYMPIYALLPNKATSFLALYSAIVNEIDWPSVKSGLACTGGQVSRDVGVALEWLLPPVDSARRNLASRWLRGDRLTPRDCERLGVAQSIRDVDHAVEALTTIMSALTSHGKRVVVMVDEYQRVAEGTRLRLREVGHGVHTLFNACPKNLTLILSCAAGGGDVNFVLTPELVSRLSLRRIELPYLTVEDVVTYIRDLFAHYRTVGFAGDPFHPFSEASVRSVAEFLIDDGRLDLTPRGTNAAFDFVLSGVMSAGSPPFAESVTAWLDMNRDAMLDRILV